MRDFSTDRPPKANVPFTVDAGHFQYETDIVNFADQANGPTRTNTLLAPNPTLKFGLTNSTELELNMPIVGVATTIPRPADGARTGATAICSSVPKSMFGVMDGGASALAFIPYIKAPTAAPGIGNGAVEEGLIAPLSVTLPSGYTFVFNSELDELKDSVGEGQHANYINVVSLSHQVINKDFTLYVELWSDYNNDPLQRTTQVSFDTALAWTVRPNLQLDIGADFGLNGATPTIQVFAGISQRF